MNRFWIQRPHESYRLADAALFDAGSDDENFGMFSKLRRESLEPGCEISVVIGD
jgi:hypothetical protein